MRSRFKNIILATAMVFLGISCTEDFSEINKNPNAPIDVPATNVFAEGIHSACGVLFQRRLDVYYAGTYSGHLANMGLGDYEYRVDINNSIWNQMYSSMYEFHDAMKIAQENENDNMYAAALTMKAYMAHQTTDMWKDIPYREAFKLESEEEIRNPHYDSQEEVYNDILEDLKTAADMFEEGAGDIGGGDLIYEGDVEKWKKFCNSIRLRVAIRMSSADETAASSVINEILNNPGDYPVMENNDDNAYRWYPGEDPYMEFWYQGMGSPGGEDPSTYMRTQSHLVDSLTAHDDPRTSVYLDTNRWGEYNGYRLGENQRSDTSNNVYNISPIGDRFTNDPAGFTPFMNSAEVYFTLAEAYARGLASGDAQTAYEEGIKTSMEENGISEGEAEAYIAQPGVAWDGTGLSNLDKIALQKWIALFKQSVEAWSESRRTDVPLIDNVAVDYLGDHNRPPFRLPYAVQEESRNENFPIELAEQQEDIFWGIQMWWDTREGVY